MKTVGIIVFPGFQVLDLAAATVFELANVATVTPVYDIQLFSERGGSVVSSAGIGVETRPFESQKFDTLILTGGLEVAPSSAGLIAFVQAAQLVSRRIASICTGAFILAEAGLLDGRRATTHWGHARDLERRFPKVKVEDDRIFIIDGPIWTSAGMTACIDLSLALIESDLGAEISRAVAKKLVVYHRRTGGQSQFSALLELEPKTDRIQNALAYAKENLHQDLSVEQLAEVARLSPRQFSRAFRHETGQSPAKAVEKLRVEAARAMMEAGRHPMDIVARETGFADRERMRRAFLRAFGQPPQTIGRAARSGAGLI
jgi:transcriptional regulator GlxA family with amidase domain